MLPDIVVLGAPSGSGKDLVGALLHVAAGYERLAFADEIRYELEEFKRFAASDSHYRAVSSEKLETLARLISLPLQTILDMDSSELWAKPTSPLARKILQTWGEYQRDFYCPDYWTSRALSRVKYGVKYVVTDARRPDEVEAVRRAFENRPGGPRVLVLEVRRDSAREKLMDHASEHDFDKIRFDGAIENNGDLMYLAKTIKTLVDGWAACDRYEERTK